MANKLTNPGRTKSLQIGSDAIGDYYIHVTGKKEYHLTTAITANSTATTAASGDWGRTTNATGNGKLFVSDGSKWQAA